MKELLSELLDLVKSDERVSVLYADFVDAASMFLLRDRFPKLSSIFDEVFFLQEICHFSPEERNAISKAENAQEVYDFLLEQAKIEHLVGGYESSEGLVQ